MEFLSEGIDVFSKEELQKIKAGEQCHEVTCIAYLGSCDSVDCTLYLDPVIVDPGLCFFLIKD